MNIKPRSSNFCARTMRLGEHLNHGRMNADAGLRHVPVTPKAGHAQRRFRVFRVFSGPQSYPCPSVKSLVTLVRSRMRRTVSIRGCLLLSSGFLLATSLGVSAAQPTLGDAAKLPAPSPT